MKSWLTGWTVLALMIFVAACGTDDPIRGAGDAGLGQGDAQQGVDATADDAGSDPEDAASSMDVGDKDVPQFDRDAGADAEDPSDAGPTADAAPCEPKTCEQLGAQCGAVDNGCGTQISCGSCGANERCGAGVEANTCICEPESAGELCSQESATCGDITVTDSCGVERTVTCGTCAAGDSCGADNTCGCQGETEQELCAANPSIQCGDITVTDSCGSERTVTCGSCPSGERCTQNNVCECQPLTCKDPAAGCGLNADGCGGQIVCAQGCDQVLALGGLHSCIGRATGGLECWGRNNKGQLGTGTFNDAATPTAVSGISMAIDSVTAGEKHTCAHVDGGIKCWGDHDNKVVGDVSSNQNTPRDITGFPGVISGLGQGNLHSCAMLENGDLYCWGYNTDGQLHTGSATYKEPSPLQAAVPTSAGAIVEQDGGPLFGCFRALGGQVYCTGINVFGNLGDGTQNDSYTPVLVSGLGTVEDIAVGGWYGSGSGSGAGYSTVSMFACALETSGALKCWGANQAGQLGVNDTQANNKAVPTQVTGLTSGVVQVTAGGDHVCALMTTGGVKCWGYNGFGQLGDGTTQMRHAPVDVVGLNAPAVWVEAGGFHTCAVLSTGELQCWGRNNRGQLGDASNTDRHTPVTIIN